MKRHFRSRSLCCAIWILSGFLTFALAQSSLADQPPPPSPPQNLIDSTESEAKEPGRVIYVPFEDVEDLTGLFEKPNTDIILPYQDYRKLIDSWRDQQTSPKMPEAVISKAEYKFHMDAGLARIAARLTIHVLADHYCEVPVHFGKAAIGSLTAPENVYLRGRGGGHYSIMLPKAGTYELKLQMAVPIHQSPESQEVTLECPSVAMTTLDVTIPGKDQKIEVQPPSVELPGEKTDQDTVHYRANVGATPRITIKWRSAESQTPEMALLSSVHNQTLVTIADGMVHTDATLTYDILRGEMSQVRIVLPKSARVLNAFSDRGDSNWKTTENGENQVVTVELSEPARQRLEMTVQTEHKLDQAEFSVIGMTEEGTADGIHALDAVRESGQIAVRHSADLTVNVVEQQGLVRIENSEADPKLAGPNALLFKFYSPQVVMKLNAKPVEPRIHVASQLQLSFREEELQIVERFQYQIDRAGLFELQIGLPDNVVIDNVQCPQMKEFNVDADSHRLTIVLREKTKGDLQLSVSGHMKLTDEMAADLKLPIPEPLHVDRETGRITVYANASMEVQVTQSDVESAQPLPLHPSQIRKGNGDLVASSSWSFSRRPVVIPVKIVRKPTRLTARVGTSIDVRPELTHVKSLVDFKVDYSGLDTFRIDVPEGISDSLQIQIEQRDTHSASIKQKTASEPADGRVEWTILTQREVLGHQRFVLSYDIVPPQVAADDKTDADATDADTNDADATDADTKESSNTAAEATFELSFVRPLGVANAQGEITTPLAELQGEVVLLKDRALSIRAEPTGQGLEQIDVRELRLLPRDGTLAFRYFRDDAENPLGVNVTSQRFEIQEVVATVISRELIEIVTSEDRAATYRCRFNMKSSERQRLLMALPKDLEVLGAFLNDREVKLEKADVPLPAGLNAALSPFWVNVARPESSDVPFLLTFQFLWKLDVGDNESMLEENLLELPLPVIAEAGQGVVQELKVVVWMPEDYALVGDPEPFLLQKRRRRPLSFLFGTPADHRTDQLDGWIQNDAKHATASVDLPTEGRVPFLYSTLGSTSQIQLRIWNRLSMTLLISVTLALIGWILLWTSWENKLGILLLMAFVAALYGLQDSQGLSQGLHAARFGLAIMIGMWLLRCLFGSGESMPDESPRETGTSDDAASQIPYAVIPPPGVFERLHPEAGDASS